MADVALDGFETYFVEKLWELIPGVYRHEDGIAQPPGTLRAVVEIMAAQAALLRRSHDRLWDDAFIELCDDWAVPYLADLVGTRLVSALNPRGRRVDVAKTIYYRRRKGTLAVLDQLTSDIAGWSGAVVESFRRLARARHGLDLPPNGFAGRFTGTPPGGWADLRAARTSELVGGPFDELHYTPDTRRSRGRAGRYGISKIIFHLLRLRDYEVEAAMPRALAAANAFTVDPSGRDTALFVRRNQTSDWDRWRPPREWELPLPMQCRVLGHAEYMLDESVIQALEASPYNLGSAAANELRALRGRRFRSEKRLRETIAALPHGSQVLITSRINRLLGLAITADSAKVTLVPDALRIDVAGATLPRELIASGDLTDLSATALARWPSLAVDKTVVVDPLRGRMLFLSAPGGPVRVTYHYGFSSEVGAGSYDRREVESRVPAAANRVHGGGAVLAAQITDNGVNQIDDSATYTALPDRAAVQALTLQAANQERPYVRLGADWLLDSGANANALIELDGLWLGASGAPRSVVLEGSYETVTIRHCTLDPGGIDAEGGIIPPVALVVTGSVERLVIERSIVAEVRTSGAGVIERLDVSDSIVDAANSAGTAIALQVGDVHVNRTTFFGHATVHRLWASELLAAGTVTVTDTQTGCFRFSGALDGSRVPRAYEAVTLSAAQLPSFFTSRRFGDAGYAQLSEAAPVSVARGAESRSEMGAFSALNGPIRLDSLQVKVDEYLPFGLVPLFPFET